LKVYVCNIAVRYAETDKMGVAHHSSYLLWFETARTGLLREAGHAYRDMEVSGSLLPVIEYNCRFFAGAEYDDNVEIDTSIITLRSRSVTFHYRARRGDELLAEGWTRHLCVSRDNVPRRIPRKISEAISAYRSPVTT